MRLRLHLSAFPPFFTPPNLVGGGRALGKGVSLSLKQ